MTTQAWTFPIDHQDDAGFRAWGADFATRLAAVGLVQTADTGQIDWGTVSRPGTNSDAGYEVWRFDDTQQASSPLFLKFLYGTDDSAALPRILCQIGDATDGAGTLTLFGGTVPTFDMTWGVTSGTQAPNGISRQSFMVHTEGFFGVLWGIGGKSGATCYANLHVARTHDDEGTPDGDAALVIYPANPNTGSSGSNVFTSNYTISFVEQRGLSGASGHSCLIPTGQSQSLVGGTDPQLFIHWAWTPRVRPIYQLASYLRPDFTDFTTVDAQLLGGSDPRTYLLVGRYPGKCARGVDNQGLAMLWE